MNDRNDPASANPFRSPSNRDTETAPAEPVAESSLAWRLLHPLNFVILGGMVLVGWLWSGEGSMAAVVFGAGVSVVGAVSWIVHKRILPTRFTISCVNVACTNLIVLALGFMAHDMREVPFDVIFDLNTVLFRGIRFSAGLLPLLFIGSCIAIIWAMILLPAFRPGLRTALVSAVGTGIWYGFSAMVLSHAG